MWGTESRRSVKLLNPLHPVFSPACLTLPSMQSKMRTSYNCQQQSSTECTQMPCIGKSINGWCMQYMKWAGISKSQEDTFWTNPTVRNLIKNDFKVLVTRKNTFNGIRYGEDDAIFAWDIYNVRTFTPFLHTAVCEKSTGRIDWECLCYSLCV